jgi:hypothetical protein
MTAPTTVIAWDPEWEEYTVKRGRASHHTDAYDDAVATAAVMARGGAIVDRVPKSRRRAPAWLAVGGAK